MALVFRAADRKADLEKRVQDLQEELRGHKKSSSQFAASFQRQLDDLSAELIQRKKKEMELHARNTELARKNKALSKMSLALMAVSRQVLPSSRLNR